jgi:kynureninase
VIADYRAPDIIRVAPIPLYNTFHEAWRFAQVLGEVTRQLVPR